MNSARNPRSELSSRTTPAPGLAMTVLDESGLVPLSPRIGVPCSRVRTHVRAPRLRSAGPHAGAAEGHAPGKLPDRPNGDARRTVGPHAYGPVSTAPGELRDRPNGDAPRAVG